MIQTEWSDARMHIKSGFELLFESNPLTKLPFFNWLESNHELIGKLDSMSAWNSWVIIGNKVKVGHAKNPFVLDHIIQA